MEHYILRPLVAMLLSTFLLACSGGDPEEGVTGEPSYSDIVAASEHFEGFLDFYRDQATGEVYMDVAPDQLEVELIYAAKYLDGIADTWSSRGVHTDAVILSLRRQYKKLEFLKPNTSFYYDPDSAIARAGDANRQPAVLAVAEIAAEDPGTGHFLAKVDPVFLSQSLTPIKPAANPEAQPGQVFTLGELSKDKTSIRELSAYPRNSQVTVNYVFEDPAPLVAPGQSSADPRIVTLVLQHNFLAMPDDGFEPRFADPRIGFFATEVTDMTGFSATPWRDPIQRWRLVKKRPGAELSEPVEPITFWLENTTPSAFRDEVEAGILAWNVLNQMVADGEDIDDPNAVIAKFQGLENIHIIGVPPVTCTDNTVEFPAVCKKTITYVEWDGSDWVLVEPLNGEYFNVGDIQARVAAGNPRQAAG